MSVENIISILDSFVAVALRNRKYAPNTAYGYKAALKVFNDELSAEERGSFDLFKERFDQIFSNIVSKKQKEYSISSLQIYKNRVLKVLSDYEKYGVDPSKMANWVPARNKPHVPKSQNKTKLTVDGFIEQPGDGGQIPASVIQADYNRHEISLRPSKRIVIIYPSDFTPKEAKSIKSFGEYLVSSCDEERT